MDKKNMYYIVITGTNILNRVSGTDRPAIVTEEAAEKEIKLLESISRGKGGFEKISIADYEEKFGAQDAGGADSGAGIPEFIVPTLIVWGGSIDDISVEQIGTSTHVYKKSVHGARQHVAVITGIHENLWKHKNYRGRLINFANQVRGGRIYFTVKVLDEEEQDET